MSDEGYSATDIVCPAAEEAAEIIMKLDCGKRAIKLSDVMSLMSERPARKHWKAVLDGAGKRLASVGLELVEIGSASVNTFFLVSKYPPPLFMHKYAAATELADRTLLFLVLTYVFMKDGTVLSGDLIEHLQKLKLYSSSDGLHPYFGNVKRKILTEFVDQLYVSCSKMPESDLFELSWGPRAEAEISKLAVLEFVCRCGYNGEIKPENLVYHYTKATEVLSSVEGDASGNCIGRDNEEICIQ